MCQAYEGERNSIIAMERAELLSMEEQRGREDYMRGVPKHAHPEAHRVRPNYPNDGSFYTDSWFRKHEYYGQFIRSWEWGWMAEYKASGQHDRDLAVTLGIAPQ